MQEAARTSLPDPHAMRLKHIEVFHAVMQTGSVSAAARLLHVTQPAVSRTLQHAELQLGFPLFERVRGRLTPTNEAAALFPMSKSSTSSSVKCSVWPPACDTAK